MQPVNLFNEILRLGPDNEALANEDFLVEALPPSGSRVSRSHPNDRDYFCIRLLYQGTAELLSKDNKAAISAPALLLSEKGEAALHSFHADCKMVSIYFSSDFLAHENQSWNDYLNQVFFHRVVQLPAGELDDFHAYFSLIIYEYQRNDAKAPAVIAGLLMNIFKMIAKIKVETNQIENLPASRLAYFRFKTLIELHFKKQHHVRAYADQLCMTAEMLGKIVRDNVNKTPKQLIDDRLITEAKRKLIWTTTTNKEIAYELGFESDSYFNRYFKKHCHQTPLSFRVNSGAIR